jgi:hypothetical protein
MGLEIFGHGIAGEILVEDLRPDGSVILLQCTPYTQRATQEAAGVTIASTQGGSWPMLQEKRVARSRHGKLHLDTTQMPGGVLSFNVSTLAEKAADALRDGVRLVELTMTNAPEWGYTGQVEKPAADDATAANGVLRADPQEGPQPAARRSPRVSREPSD